MVIINWCQCKIVVKIISASYKCVRQIKETLRSLEKMW